MSNNLVRYCPGSASGSPAYMSVQAAELQAAKDHTTINKLLAVDSIELPVYWPHVGGTCKRCQLASREANQPREHIRLWV